MKFCASTDIGTWTNGLTFGPIRIIVRIQEPDLHRIFEFQRDIWRRYWRISMKFYAPIAAGGLHDLIRFWAVSGSEFRSWIRTWIQNCKADSAKSNGQISVKFYGWIACESRKTAFNFGSDRDWDWLRASGGSPYHITTFGSGRLSEVNALYRVPF